MVVPSMQDNLPLLCPVCREADRHGWVITGNTPVLWDGPDEVVWLATTVEYKCGAEFMEAWDALGEEISITLVKPCYTASREAERALNAT